MSTGEDQALLPNEAHHFPPDNLRSGMVQHPNRELPNKLGRSNVVLVDSNFEAPLPWSSEILECLKFEYLKPIMGQVKFILDKPQT